MMFIVAAPWSLEDPRLAIFKFWSDQIIENGTPEKYLEHAKSVDPSMDWAIYDMELKKR